MQSDTFSIADMQRDFDKILQHSSGGSEAGLDAFYKAYQIVSSPEAIQVIFTKFRFYSPQEQVDPFWEADVLGTNAAGLPEPGHPAEGERLDLLAEGLLQPGAEQTAARPARVHH